jgi:predicted transposase/invertase (TIGR01784 family)
MIPGIDPRVDYAFKKVFGSESNIALLRSLLEAVLKPRPDERITDLEIRNPFNEKDNLDDKLSILDIKVRDQRGQQYNVEMQMVGSRVYPQRIVYYWSRLHGEQLHSGDDYRMLQPTISISFLDSVLFPRVPDYHLDFRLRSSQHPELIFSPHLAIHLLELPKFRLKAEELANPLEQWTYFLVHGNDLDKDDLPAALRDTPVRQAMEVLTMITQSELERDRYEARLKWERDQRAREQDYEEARAEAEKFRAESDKARAESDKARAESEKFRAESDKARAELAEVRVTAAKSEVIGRIHVCQRLLKLSITPTDQLTAQSVDDLQTLAAALEQKLGLVD